MKKIKYLILYLIFVSCNSFAVIESVSLLKLGNKKVLILGDLHVPQNVEDQRDKQVVVNWINLLSRSKSNIVFKLEASDWHLKLTQDSLKNQGMDINGFQMYFDLPLLAQDNNKKIGNISFEFIDNRTKNIRCLVESFTILDNPLAHLPEFFVKMSKFMKKELKCSATLDHFFQGVKVTLESLTAELNKLGLGSPACDGEAFDLVQKYIDEIQNFVAVGKQLTEKFKSDIPYIDAYSNSVAKAQSVKHIVKHVYGWILPLANRILDLNIFASVVNSLKNTDNIVIFGGNVHALRAVEFLKLLKFEVCYQAGNTKTDETKPARFENAQFKAGELEKLLKQAFELPAIICANPACDKEGTKRCGQCKKVHYCSGDCQKAHWNTGHKEVCKKQLEEKKDVKDQK